MSNNPHLLTRKGVDHLSLDKRNFDPSQDDIEGICRFFAIGKPRHYEKEKGIIISHSNFFFFVATDQGQYALKFYPPDAAKSIAVEYAVNRLLLKHHFLTPLMHAGRGGRPFIASNDRLAACFAYIDGQPAWQHIKQQNTIRQINTAMLSIKNIFSAGTHRLPFQKQGNLLSNAGALAKDSRALAVYDQKEMIEASLHEVCRTYQHDRVLFTRQNLHNNASLTNFLIYKKSVYTLDLSHIREDYALADLASLVISCLFFNIPAATVKTIVKNYFTLHKMGSKYLPVLNALVTVGLIREYLKNIQREKSPGLSAYPADLARTYTSLLSKRNKCIVGVMKKINDNPGLIV
jgi:Ser/Thr protein kinase RdoA (MazF antagonist)